MATRGSASIQSLSVTTKRRSLRGAAKRSNTRARELELRIWGLLAEGKSPSAIARVVGIARPSVHRVINRVEARYQKMIAATVEQMKSAQARILERTVDHALEAWEASKLPAKRVKKTTAAAGSLDDRSGRRKEPVETTQTEVELRIGDVRFLAEARAALADLRKLYGLDATKSSADDDLPGIAYIVTRGEHA